MTRWMIFALSIGCVSCGPNGSADQTKAPIDASGTQAAVNREPPRPAVPSLPDTFPPLPSRNMNDMVAGCAHQNPAKRPRGSNCFGIFPEQCGADKAKAFTGQIATPALLDRIRSFTTSEFPRFIMPLEAVTDDLRYGRLNVQMDETRKIVSVDCY